MAGVGPAAVDVAAALEARKQELQELLREAASSRPVLQQLLDGLTESAKVQVAPLKGLVRACVRA